MKKRIVLGAAPAVLALALVLFLSPSSPAYADDDLPSWLIVDGGGEGESPSAGAEEALLSAGITLTTSDHVSYLAGDGGYFRPEGSLTRAQAAQIIFRLLSQRVPITRTFSDVPEDAWYAQAANTLGSLGVARPGQDTFCPDEAITRAEFVRYVASFFPIRRDAQQFTDVPAAHPEARYLLSARSWGWLTGFDGGSVHPDAAVTRAEAAAMLNRALGRSPDKSYINSAHPVFYWDVSPGSWYYYDVVEASVSHEHTGSGAAERWTSCTAVSAGLADGFNLVDGWLYYFDSSKNDIVRGASVGTFTFNALGRFTSGNEELDALLHNIYLENTTEDMTQEEKLRALYVYTRDSFAYRRRPPYPFGVLDYMEEDALRILTTGYGNCYCYASVFWYLSRWIGYDARIVNGTVGQRKSPHSWVEITFDGVSYIFDTELEMSYIKKGQPVNMYKWTGSGWNYIG